MTSETPIFVFGTLLDADVRALVLGYELTAARRPLATLPDHTRVRLPDETYPILSPAPGGGVSGELLLDLSEQTRQRLAFFESSEYELATCTVYLPDAKGVRASYHAEADVVPGACEPWRLDWWQHHHKAEYLEMITPYMALFDTGTLEQAEALWTALTKEREQND